MVECIKKTGSISNRSMMLRLPKRAGIVGPEAGFGSMVDWIKIIDTLCLTWRRSAIDTASISELVEI
jgi:hypothetical protein